MLYVDVRNKPISMSQDGAKVVVLRFGPNELTLLAHYEEGSTSEIYSFFREKGREEPVHGHDQSRVGPRAVFPKSSLMVGDYDPIRFDLIK